LLSDGTAIAMKKNQSFLEYMNLNSSNHSDRIVEYVIKEDKSTIELEDGTFWGCKLGLSNRDESLAISELQIVQKGDSDSSRESRIVFNDQNFDAKIGGAYNLGEYFQRGELEWSPLILCEETKLSTALRIQWGHVSNDRHLKYFVEMIGKQSVPLDMSSLQISFGNFVSVAISDDRSSSTFPQSIMVYVSRGGIVFQLKLLFRLKESSLLKVCLFQEDS
jgi:hypothetical protein